MIFHRLLIIMFLTPLLFAAKPQFSDNQILAMTPHYFDRNQAFAYSALTNMGQYAKKPIKQLIVVMHSDNERNPPQVCIGKAKCSIDFWIHQKGEYQNWYKDCIHFKEL